MIDVGLASCDRESCCKVLLSYDTMCEKHCVQQGFVIPLPQIVLVPYSLKMLLGYSDTKSGDVIDDDVLSSRGALLYYTLFSITNWVHRFLGATR
jgi:hypothetical protein